MHWDFETLKNWLYTVPQWPAVENLWTDLDALLRRQSNWTRLDDGSAFEVYADGESGLLFRTQGRDYPCPGSALEAFWQLIESAAYVYPADLPPDLELPPVLLFSLLANLEYLHPVILARIGSDRQIGLYFVPALNDGRSRVA